jgi:hypothetical protein
MATLNVALVREQGVNFAVLAVKDHVVDSPTERETLVSQGAVWFGMPTVLIGERRHRIYGRPDIVRFLRNVQPSRLPWRQMTVAA